MASKQEAEDSPNQHRPLFQESLEHNGERSTLALPPLDQTKR